MPGYVAPPRNLYTQERQVFLTDEMRKAFPRLGGNFVVVGPANDKSDAFRNVFGPDFRVDPADADEKNPDGLREGVHLSGSRGETWRHCRGPAETIGTSLRPRG